MKKLVSWVLGPLLAVLFLALAFHDADWGALGASFRSASIPLLAMLFASGVAHMALRSWRWGTLLDPVRPRRELAFVERMSATAIGNMALVIPGRVGEVLRPALLSRRAGLPFGTTLATVGVERVVLDMMAIAVFAAAGLLLPSRLSGLGAHSDAETLASLRATGTVLMLGTVGTFVAVVVVARRRVQFTAWLDERAARTGLRPLAALLRWAKTMLPGLAAFASGSRVARLIVESFVIWGTIAIGLHCGVAACGIELAPLSSLIVVPVAAVGIAVPTPGGVGSYHAVMKGGLSLLLGAPEATALAAATLVHGVTLLSLVLTGTYFVVRGGLQRPAEAGPERTTPAAGESP